MNLFSSRQNLRKQKVTEQMVESARKQKIVEVRIRAYLDIFVRVAPIEPRERTNEESKTIFLERETQRALSSRCDHAVTAGWSLRDLLTNLYDNGGKGATVFNTVLYAAINTFVFNKAPPPRIGTRGYLLPETSPHDNSDTARYARQLTSFLL